MLDGRVKTLHPAIHAGILADRQNPTHRAELEREGIEPIDLVVCNLYPFESDPSIELIDIGGPTMVRAAAKNHAHVGVVVDANDYSVVIDEFRREGRLTDETRMKLAATAFSHVAAYDAAIANWFYSDFADGLPPAIHLALEQKELLRYGENPHQRGARYTPAGATIWWDGVVQHSGRELSFLNLVDVEAAWTTCHSVIGIGDATTAAVIVKHANPCGVAIGSDAEDVYQKAFAADETSAFGGIVAISTDIDDALAEAIAKNPLADVLIAPGSFPALSLCSPRSGRTCESSRRPCLRSRHWLSEISPKVSSSRTETSSHRAATHGESSRSGRPPRRNGSTQSSLGGCARRRDRTRSFWRTMAWLSVSAVASRTAATRANRAGKGCRSRCRGCRSERRVLPVPRRPRCCLRRRGKRRRRARGIAARRRGDHRRQ